MRKTQKVLLLTLLVAFLSYFYNIIRFPLFNNAFDPWIHLNYMESQSLANGVDLKVYYGFPGMHILVIFLARAINADLFTMVRYFPLFTSMLSIIVMILFLKHLMRESNSQSKREILNTDEIREKVLIFGCLVNCTISIYSVISTNLFWGQMFTSTLVPLIIIKFLEVNRDPDNRCQFEYLMLVLCLFFTHHLTCFILVTFLAFAQLYLVFERKATINGFLVTFISISIFFLRYDLLDLNLGFISDITQGKFNYFYIYFIILLVSVPFITFAKKYSIILMKKISKRFKNKGKAQSRIKTLLTSKKTIIVFVLFGIVLSFILLRYIFPFILSFYESLSGEWFLYYGSNLFLLVPLTIVGLLIFGSVLGSSRLKILIYLWISIIFLLLLLLIGIYLLNLPVGSLEFGRLTTFIYPFMSIFAAFAILSISSRSNHKIKSGTWFRFKTPRVKKTVKIAVLASFVLLTPFSIVGFNPPPNATLTRYWNTPSERLSVEWSSDRAKNNTWMNMDYHLLIMGQYYHKTPNRTYVLSSYRYFYQLTSQNYLSELAKGRNYLIMVDEVMLEDSFSYSEPGTEHGTLDPLGYEILNTYDRNHFMNKLYSSDNQWIYQVFIPDD